MSDTAASQPRRTRVERGIYRKPNGGFEIGWKDASGRQRWRSVKGGITAARRMLAEEHARRGRGEQTVRDPRLTFNAAADEWMATRVVRLRPNTQSNYRYALVHLRERFGTRRLTAITAADVARYVTDMQARGYKGWTLKGHLTAISAVYTFATRHLGYAGVSPTSLLDRTERPSTEDAKPVRVLTGDERRAVLEATDPAYLPMFRLAAETGVRASELLAIRWGGIDLTDGTVEVTAQLERKTGALAPLKTARARRTLEITPGTVALLRELKVASLRTGDDDLAFVTRKGTPHDVRNVAGRALGRAVKRAGLDGQGVDFHGAFRHSHASQLIASGWDPVEVSARLGHSSVAITMEIYAHEFERAQRTQERRDRLTALYGMEAPMEASESNPGQAVADGGGGQVALRLA